MPYPVKIQPIDFNANHDLPLKFEKPILFKSRFKRLIEKQFSNVLRSSASDHKSTVEEFEPSSVCLTRMVQNFIEEINDKQQQKCGRNQCNCFNGNNTESSDEEGESYGASDVLKNLVSCLCVSERNLLAETAKIVERTKNNKLKDCEKNVANALIALGYSASICKSEWKKSPSYPAGKYEYVDVILEGERLIIDIDFRSEFEIARPTKAYKLILQTLPIIFVGKSDRLESIIGIVSKAAKQSMKKRGMPIPPWRKAGYMKAKWLSPFTRISQINDKNEKPDALTAKSCSSLNEFELVFGEKEKLDSGDGGFVVLSNTNNSSSFIEKNDDGSTKKWEPPEIRPRSLIKGVKIVTGLASVIYDKP